MPIFDEPSRQPLPQPTFEDVAHAGRKGLLSLIPFVGGVGSELLGLLSSPVAERRDDWFADLERRLRDLKGRVQGFRFDDLGQNQQFVSATLQATQAALRTHQAEKLYIPRILTDAPYIQPACRGLRPPGPPPKKGAAPLWTLPGAARLGPCVAASLSWPSPSGGGIAWPVRYSALRPGTAFR